MTTGGGAEILMVNQLIELGNLTREENTFIVWLSGKLDRLQPLTPKEVARLEGIYALRM